RKVFCNGVLFHQNRNKDLVISLQGFQAVPIFSEFELVSTKNNRFYRIHDNTVVMNTHTACYPSHVHWIPKRSRYHYNSFPFRPPISTKKCYCDETIYLF